MQNFLKQISTQAPLYAPVILRLALSGVFVWFGTNQILNAPAWTGLVPQMVTSVSGLSATLLVHLNGVFEVIAGLLMAIGFMTRWVSLLLALHLFGITFNLGLSAIGVRDFGLSFATLAVAMFGDDIWGIKLAPKSSPVA